MLHDPALGRNGIGKVEVHCEELRGQLPTCGDKTTHCRLSPMHDECAQRRVSPCTCKRSEVTGTADPGAEPELTVTMTTFCHSCQQDTMAILVLWYQGTVVPSSTFSATEKKKSHHQVFLRNFHQVLHPLKLTVGGGVPNAGPAPNHKGG